MTSSLSFPGCSHPGLVVAPSPGFDFTGLVVWSLLAPRSWEPPSQSSPFSRSVAFWRLCGASYSPPLVSSLTAARFGLWPYGLAIAALPLFSRPTPLLVSSVESQLCECLFVVLPRQLVGSGVYSPASPICPTSSVLKRSSFGISASVFASSLRDVGHPSGSSLSQSSIGTKSLPPPSWCLVGVFAMGSPCRVDFVRSRSERRLFAHLP